MYDHPPIVQFNLYITDSILFMEDNQQVVPHQSWWKPEDLEDLLAPSSSYYASFANTSCAYQFIALTHLANIKQSYPQIYAALPTVIKEVDVTDLDKLHEVYVDNKIQIEAALNGNFIDLSSGIMNDTTVQMAQQEEGHLVLQTLNSPKKEGKKERVYILVEETQPENQEMTLVAIYDYKDNEQAKKEQSSLSEKDAGKQQEHVQSQPQSSDPGEPTYSELSSKVGWCWSCLKSNIVVDRGLCWECFRQGQHLPTNKYLKPAAYGFICFLLTLASVMVLGQ